MTTLIPLASSADLTEFSSSPELLQNEERWPPSSIDRLMVRATRAIETRCDRRLAPFTITETTRAEGVANDSSPNDDVPLDLRSALGRAQSMAFGATSLVRDFWLAQYAPVYQDLWSYSISKIELVTSYGGTQTITPPSNIEGPEADTGHLRLRLGTFCPPGTTVRFTYSGGYSPIPDDLNLACILQAMKFVMIGAEPYSREGLSTAGLDDEIVGLIASFIRY